MINYNNNPIIFNDNEPNGIFLAQTRDTLMDPEIYKSFLYSAQTNFRKSKFYTDYKADLMFKGLDRDQRHAAITSDMAPIEMHHNFITLNFMSIILTEHTLNTKGCITTFELMSLLEEQHRKNRVAVIMLSETEHQKHHDDPTDFISLKQCFCPHIFDFINLYMDGITLDICYKLLLHLKQEEQYGESFSPNMARARDQLLNWKHLIKGDVIYNY